MRKEIEAKASAARRRLIEAESSAVRALGSARALIVELEEENRQLREMAARGDDVIYTEKEFAKLFKVSWITIKRLRLEGKLMPLWFGTHPRYSRAEHVAKAAEIFGQTKTKHLRGVA